MKYLKTKSLILILVILFSHNVSAIDQKIYDFNGNESKTDIIKKVKALNSKSVEIKVDGSSGKLTTIIYEPAQTFTPGEKPIFEHVESNNVSDVINREIIFADTKTGRLFHLNSEHKVFKLILTEPWVSKVKLRSIRDILIDVTTPKIEKNKEKNEEKK